MAAEAVSLRLKRLHHAIIDTCQRARYGGLALPCTVRWCRGDASVAAFNDYSDMNVVRLNE